MDGQFWLSVLANKFMYQSSTFIRALALMMVGKGYSPKDGNGGTYAADASSNAAVTALVAVLNNLITNADLQNSGSPYAGMLLATSSSPSNAAATVGFVNGKYYVTSGGAPPQLIESGATSGSATVTFSHAFSGTPVVVATPVGAGTANLSAISSTGFTVASSDGAPVNWIAIGPQ